MPKVKNKAAVRLQEFKLGTGVYGAPLPYETPKLVQARKAKKKAEDRIQTVAIALAALEAAARKSTDRSAEFREGVFFAVKKLRKELRAPLPRKRREDAEQDRPQ